jgi:dihydroorotase
VLTTAEALAYRSRILAAVPPTVQFEPLMSLYLGDHTEPGEILKAKVSRGVYGVKLYPAGATTHSQAGVTALEKTFRVLSAMEACGMPLLIHGEVPDPKIDIFAREQAFIETWLVPLIERFPGLRVVLEHITTREAVEFVDQGPPTLGATITAHHLALNRNAMFAGGLRPHYFCLPVLKREDHRLALVRAATGANPRFFLGTDTAPHPRTAKESACGCAGIYSAPNALQTYAEVFEAAGALERLEAFASFRGADFYGLPRNAGCVHLVKRSWKVPDEMPLGEQVVVPFRAGENVAWSVTT